MSFTEDFNSTTPQSRYSGFNFNTYTGYNQYERAANGPTIYFVLPPIVRTRPR